MGYPQWGQSFGGLSPTILFDRFLVDVNGIGMRGHAITLAFVTESER